MLTPTPGGPTPMGPDVISDERRQYMELKQILQNETANFDQPRKSLSRGKYNVKSASRTDVDKPKDSFATLKEANPMDTYSPQHQQ